MLGCATFFFFSAKSTLIHIGNSGIDISAQVIGTSSGCILLLHFLCCLLLALICLTFAFIVQSLLGDWYLSSPLSRLLIASIYCVISLPAKKTSRS